MAKSLAEQYFNRILLCVPSIILFLRILAIRFSLKEQSRCSEQPPSQRDILLVSIPLLNQSSISLCFMSFANDIMVNKINCSVPFSSPKLPPTPASSRRSIDSTAPIENKRRMSNQARDVSRIMISGML